MKRIWFVSLVVLALGCKDSTSVAPLPLLTVWHLVAADQLLVPFDTQQVNGEWTKIVSRTLDLRSNGEGIWRDSSFTSAVPCDMGRNAPFNAMCNTSGHAIFDWKKVGDTLTVTRQFGATVGYVVPVMVFVQLPDGRLIKTNEGYTEVYRP